ncbi:hypothetical protein PROFUN_00267 [Planoprotostelium fungivorum]|uniref:Uncharacterized protein n=1 Tax=Planoprotostelium fungivorum TaxID=1890364 RepID=A0A2P6NXX4_9EUKA|nr:hypothetical protein PROFUN_00267 [Planoprotostelium fungivorum]
MKQQQGLWIYLNLLCPLQGAVAKFSALCIFFSLKATSKQKQAHRKRGRKHLEWNRDRRENSLSTDAGFHLTLMRGRSRIPSTGDREVLTVLAGARQRQEYFPQPGLKAVAMHISLQTRRLSSDMQILLNSQSTSTIRFNQE